MAPSTRSIYQNLVEVDTPPLEIKLINEQDLNLDTNHLRGLIDRNDGRAIGLAGSYSLSGSLLTLAVADTAQVIVIEFYSTKTTQRKSGDRSTDGRKFLEEHVLCRPTGHSYAFDMAPLALALWKDHNTRITNARDIQTAGPSKSRVPYVTIHFAVGDLHAIYKENVTDIFRDATHGSNSITPLVLRAWIAHYVSQLPIMEDRFFQIASIDTTKLTENVLSFLAKSASESYQLGQMKPTEVVHRFDGGASWDSTKMQVRAKADRYQNRIRRGSNQHARIAIGGARGFSVLGEVDEVDGQAANLATTGDLEGKVVKGITIIGREDPTAAEAQRDLAILHVLQGKVKLEGENPWVQRIWLMSTDFTWPQVWSTECPAPAVKFNPSRLARPLNPSQITAVKDMLQQTDDSRITIIQGPPGTGKTTVIASYVQTALNGGRSGIWLLAQSNVAVKNIAEKLVAFGIYNWKLLVSQDFFEYWHEHLYIDIRSNIILSKDFSLPGLLCRELKDCPVVLCTLSMLSNRILQLQGVFHAVPLKTIIVDEASQIEIGDYIPLFTAHTSIRKVCFIGDDKQLPPYGQDNIEELQSIFEVQHLRDQTILLNTQYRMPPQIGDFISQAIYDSKLESNPLHPITTDIMACHFINISPGAEEASGTSYKNTGECHAILKIAAHLEEHHKNYRIITPYEGQRSTIEEAMKSAELSWEDKCFNVDSFQGNEDDYIIISLVRSGGLGFLSDLRRTNVMLTRCKRGMFICTSKAFMERAGKDSLVGSLLEYYDNEAWMEVSELETIQL